jgi:beta-mannosidase
MNKRVELKDNWTLQMEGDSQVYKVKIPGTVQTDLLVNSKVPQPFYRTNEVKYQWIDKKNWIYKTQFVIDSANFHSSKIFLNFKGLDTYAEVKLNDKKILDADNFFRSWRIEVKESLRVGKNNLTIHFKSPVHIGLEKLKKHGYPLPAVNDQSEVGGLGDKRISIFTRKAPYHYGWDWGPRFVTIGIWRPVFLEFIDNAEITDVFFNQDNINSNLAELSVFVDVSSSKPGDYYIVISDPETEEKYINKKVSINGNQQIFEFNIKIKNPELWWPNGYGSQHLYNFKVDLLEDGNTLHSENYSIGLREIKVVREEDVHGKSFYFKVNGLPIFAKGANYIPNDVFLPRVSSEKYEHIIKSAFDANMNMIRVWGGGIYENELFYDLCDKYGLLVWQDFMYACSMYPGDEQFINNAKLEAIENVKKLRNRACLALWCGNNEIDLAWCHWDENCGWGWKELYNDDQKKQIWKSYDTLFHKVLPDIVGEYSPNTFYWPSSPIADWGKPSSYSEKSGDMHYWGVWHGGEPFEKFEDVIPRFMSEYGFQSFPEFNTINEFTLPQDWDIYSEVMLAHQRSAIGNQKIKEYMEHYYKVPNDFKDFIYVGQLLQAYGIGKAIDFHRANKPFCMGTLYWQLNDCWPGASWSSIDYFGNWKALHYIVKEVFEPTRAVVLQKGNLLEVCILNDDIKVENGVLQLEIFDFLGQNLYQSQQSVQFRFDSSTMVTNINLSELPDKIDPKKSFLIAKLFVKDNLVSENIHYFVLPKDLELPPSSIQHEIIENSDSYQVVLKSKNLEKDVAISIPEVSAIYSDNYFDLLPGQSRTIHVQLTRIENNVLNKGLEIRTLNNINNNN